MSKGIEINKAKENYTSKESSRVGDFSGVEVPTDELLKDFHPDHKDNSLPIEVGVNKGDSCHKQLAELLQADSMIDEADLAGTRVFETDVLVIGGGGAGCAAALKAVESGAKVIMATKLRLGDSNTVMAEGGIQASIEKDDTPQMHFDDTIKGGHHKGNPELVKQLIMDAPDVIRWLIEQGMQFDTNEFGDLLTRRAGGTSANRVVFCKDYTGLEMMRVLRESVRNRGIEVWEYHPAVELLTDKLGNIAGAVLKNVDENLYVIIKAKSVILTTGGLGRLHLNGFPTSNHFGATGDGLVLAYRAGASLKNLDSFQYHPTGLAWPKHLSGFLITEGVRSAGATLVNGNGERFVDELKPRDYVTAAILKEVEEGRGVVVDEGTSNEVHGVWLDTAGLEKKEPGIIEKKFPRLIHTGKTCGVDPRKEPILIHPTLHYQNGGVEIDKNCRTSVKGLYASGEVSGGIHGTNRLMGNALLEIISFGRTAGLDAAEAVKGKSLAKPTIEHIKNLRRELTLSGRSLDKKSPMLFPLEGNVKEQA